MSTACLTTEPNFYWCWGFCGCLSFIDKNLRTVARCYVKHRTPEPPLFLPSSWPFFCAQRTLVAYELNVSWQADSELAEGGGGSEGQEGKIRGGGRGGGGVGGSSLRHLLSRRGLELVLPRLRPPTNHMRRTESKIDVRGAHCCSNNNLFSLLMALHRNTVWICWISACEINTLFCLFFFYIICLTGLNIRSMKLRCYL